MAASTYVSGWGDLPKEGLFKILPGSLNPYIEFRANKDEAYPRVADSIERYVPLWYGENEREDRDGIQDYDPQGQNDDECWDGTE
jgi:hypothetical protein